MRAGAGIDVVPRQDVAVAILMNKILSADDQWTKGRLEQELQQELKVSPHNESVCYIPMFTKCNGGMKQAMCSAFELNNCSCKSYMYM